MRSKRIERKPLDLVKIQKLSNQITQTEEMVRTQAKKLATVWSKLVSLSDQLYVETDATTVEARKLLTEIDRITGFTPLIDVGSDGVHAIHIISKWAAKEGNHLAGEEPKITEFHNKFHNKTGGEEW